MRPTLEAESGPEGHVQIVVGAVIEIHHVTGFRSQSEHVADKELHTRAGVEHPVRVAIENATKGVGKACSRSAMGHTEVEEPAFQNQIGPHRSHSGLDLGPEYPAQQPQARRPEGSAQPVAAGAGKVLREVIADITFKLQVVVHIESQASAQSY